MASMTQIPETTVALVTRRQLLAVGIAASAVCVFPLAESARHIDRAHEGLYVFPAQQAGNVTLLVTCNPRVDDSRATETRFHLGATVHSLHTARLAQAVQFDLPAQQVAGEPVWAERICSGSRHRIASPFLAALLAEAPALSLLYDSGSPGTDQQKLTVPLARVIGARARRAGFPGDPQNYGRRLAAALLPDVLHFDPARPAGFTFAARNGRHPADAVSGIVNSILNGTAHVTSL